MAAAAAASGGGSKAAPASGSPIEGISTVVVHPLVMLSVTDHYKRVAMNTKKRVVGMLLGHTHKGRVDVVNSFAVPFAEDPTDPKVWFLDHFYMDKMYKMFRKVAIKEKLIGFYSTGPDVKAADIGIDELLRSKGVAHPVFVVIDVRPHVEGMPVQTYATREVMTDARVVERQFEHLPNEIGASETEEVAVEHLLREVNDPSVSELGAALSAKVEGLRGLESRLVEIASYLDDVASGKLPLNREIVDNVQTMLALLPNLSVAELSESLQRETNDMHLAMMLSSLVRAVIGLHDLASNRIKYRHLDAAGEAVDDDEEDAAAKTEDETKEAGKAASSK